MRKFSCSWCYFRSLTGIVVMEKYLTKTYNHTAVKVTAADRARNYPKGTLHADDGLLFCSTCNVVIDHSRKSKIDKHLESGSHIEKAQNQSTGKQQTLKTSFECKTTTQVEKVKICQAWIKACAILHNSRTIAVFYRTICLPKPAHFPFFSRTLSEGLVRVFSVFLEW